MQMIDEFLNNDPHDWGKLISDNPELSKDDLIIVLSTVNAQILALSKLYGYLLVITSSAGEQ